MWSSSGGGEEQQQQKGLSRGGSSSSSTSFFSSPSPFDHRSKTMEEVWKDINLSSLQDPSRHDPQTTSFRGMILQDFLGAPFSKDPTASGPAVSARYGSPAPPSATMLTLKSGHELHFFGGQQQHLHHHQSNPLLPQHHHQPLPPASTQSMPLDAFALASANGKNRFPESENDSCYRRHKRMIKNRESAARSRARKQAYTNELELEVAHLVEENARLKKQQQQFRLAAAAQPPKKDKPHRCSTAPF